MPTVTPYPSVPIMLHQGETAIDYTGNSKLSIYAAETTKRFAYGCPAIDLMDGSIFRYGLATTGGVTSQFGAANSYGGNSAGSQYNNTISSAVAPTQTGDATGAIGMTCIKVTITAYDGVASDGVVTENELIGGTAIIGNGAYQYPDVRRIIANTGKVAGAGSIFVWLNAPITSTIAAWTASSGTAAANIEILANTYKALVSGNYSPNAYVSFMGIPNITAAATYNFWLRRKGPVWITSNSNTNYAANSRDLFFVSNGSIVSGDAITYAGAAYQRAGYAMEKTSSTHSGPPLCFLQLE